MTEMGQYRPIATTLPGNLTMLKRYGDRALKESAARADELARDDDGTVT
jgi:hypothetical protein